MYEMYPDPWRLAGDPASAESRHPRRRARKPLAGSPSVPIGTADPTPVRSAAFPPTPGE